MKFEFEKPLVIPIYGNHGDGPYRTDYKMNFKVDGIAFMATYSDVVKEIKLYCNDTLITHDIKRSGSADEIEKIKDVIKNAFETNYVAKKVLHKLKSEPKANLSEYLLLDKMKENICKDLLSGDDWS